MGPDEITWRVSVERSYKDWILGTPILTDLEEELVKFLLKSQIVNILNFPVHGLFYHESALPLPHKSSHRQHVYE